MYELNLETQRISIEGSILKTKVVPTDRRIIGACFPTSDQADIHSRDRTLAYAFSGWSILNRGGWGRTGTRHMRHKICRADAWMESWVGASLQRSPAWLRGG